MAGVFGAPMAYGYYNRRLKGRPLGEILGAVAAALKGFACRLNALLRWLYRRFKEGQRYLSKDKN